MSYISKIKLPGESAIRYIKDGDVRVAVGVVDYCTGQAYSKGDFILYGESDGVKALYEITADITASQNTGWATVTKIPTSVVNELEELNDAITDALPLVAGDNITITPVSNGVKIGVTSTTPVSHADSTTKYGAGTTSLYGHVKLVDGDLNGKTTTNGLAASQAHTHSQYLTANSTLNPEKLDANKKIPMVNLPDVVLGQLVYGGTVTGAGVATLSTNAKTKLDTKSSSITLTNNTTATTGYGANEGIYYIVSSNGSFASLGLVTGDWLISTGSAWKKIDNTDAVTSVNNKTGAVTIGTTTTKISAAASGGSVALNNGTAITYGNANVGTAVNVGTSLTGTTTFITAALGSASLAADTAATPSFSFNTDAIKSASLTGTKTFNTDAIKSASLTGTKTFATAGVTVAMDTDDSEMLIISSAGTGTVGISTTAASTGTVGISTTAATKQGVKVSTSASASTGTVGLGTSSITPAVASTSTFTPKTSATLTVPTITISSGDSGNVTVVTGLN